MSFGIKIRQADKLYSEWLRRKVGYCERCGRKGEGEKGISGLQCSHFHGRRVENTRFDSENTDCLCFLCHQRFEEHPSEYTEWKKKKLGEKRFKLLTLAANTYRKKDDVLVVMLYKKLLKELEK